MQSQRQAGGDKKKMSSTSEAVRKRNVGRACAQCRRRKSKCDGGHPCSTCALYHDECSYSQEQDGRRPAAKSYVLALEERVKMLEGLLRQADLNETGQRLGLGAETGEPDHSSDVAEEGLGRLKASAAPRRSASQTLTAGKQLDEETNELLHYGPTSAFQHLPEPDQVSSPDRDLSTSQSPGASLASMPRGSFQSHGAAAMDGEIEWSLNLPDQLSGKWDASLHEDLLRLFFCYFNPWCLWVDEMAFRRDMYCCLAIDRAPTAPQRTGAYSPLLHNALLSLACSLSDDVRLADGTDAKGLAAKAKSCIDDEGERPMLSALQGLLLLGSYHSGNGLQGLGYLYSGIAFRLCHTLGLGIRSTPYVARGLLLEQTRIARDRTMWCSYVQDKLWSSYVGRNPSILQGVIEAPLPDIDAEMDAMPWSPCHGAEASSHVKPAASYSYSTFHYTCRLAIIEEKILTLVYGLRVHLYSAQVLNRVSELHLELESWASSLPIELRIAPQTSRPPPPHIIMLNCMYFFCVILLHRPYYTRHHAPNNLPINDTSIKRCNSAATRILSLFELYQKSPGLRYAPISATQIAFAAATTHLLALVNAEASGQLKRAAEAEESSRSCGQVLREMGKGYSCALQTAGIFDRLVAKWHPQAAPQPQPAMRTDESSPSSGNSSNLNLAHIAARAADDPQSDFVRELIRLGWTPPVSASQATQPAAPQQMHSAPDAPAALSQASWPFGFSGSASPASQPQAYVTNSAASPTTNPFDRFGSWPFFATGVPATTTGSQPLPDDILAGLISAEGRGASEAALRSDLNDHSAFFAALGGPSNGWYGFGGEN